MTQRRSRVLIAVQRQELFGRFQAHIAGDSRAEQTIRAQHCLHDQVDSHIREYDADAVIVIEPRFQENMPALVRHWKILRPEVQVLFMFRRLPNTRALVDLMRSGAFDVLDTEIEAIGPPIIEQVLHDLMRRLAELRGGGFERDKARDALAGVGLIGETAEMQNVFMQVLHAAKLSCPVLVTGESGSGKRLTAHAIHEMAQGGAAQLITLDCQSLSPVLLGAALLGTSAAGANHTNRSSVLSATGVGTVLLNEVSEMPLDIQGLVSKKLELADSGSGARLISTTSKRMDQLVELKAFRADLCYRLNVLQIEIPPLRRRLPDVGLLARYFVSRFEREGRRVSLDEDAADALSRYHWPGNVRELRVALALAASQAVDGVILPAHLPDAVNKPDRRASESTFASSELNLERLERQAILRALQVSGFDKTKASRLLGIGKTTMYRKLKLMSGR